MVTPCEPRWPPDGTDRRAALLWCAGSARGARDATAAVTAFAGLIAAAVCLLAAFALLSPRARQYFARAAG